MDLLIARIVLALAVILGMPKPAAASTVERLDLPQVTSRAEQIVRGRVLSTTAERLAEGVIVTRVEFLVSDALRGAGAGERLVFRVPGGEVGDEGLRIPGMPRFTADDELVLFLTRPTALGVRVPVGLGQGVLRLRRDAAGVLRVERDLGGVDLVDPADGEPADPQALPSDAWDVLRPLLARLVADDDARRAAARDEAPAPEDADR
ncbi:MAG: hypothetical protein H6825_02145 [Planctomycetes bacterium]|nr:hypothetical protein [Planctomycetota bacterium]